MRLIFLDFETYYDTEYSLRKMTPAEYVLDPRFEAVGCAVKEDKNSPYWVNGPDLQRFFDDIGAKDCAFISHNALFDMCIVAWRFNTIPKLMIDTLGMARATLGYKLRSVSLDAVAAHLGLPRKSEVLKQVIGMSGAAIRASTMYGAYIDYAIGDAERCAGIYNELAGKAFPFCELSVMDMVLRCAIQPQFLLDRTVLAEHLHEIQSKKEHMLAQAMLLGADGKADLMSNDKFAALLANLGVDPPTKISPVTQKVAWAFAKTDHGLIELEDHEDPAVQTLVAARLGHKSTLEETRTQRFTKISQLSWPGPMPPPGQTALMPMPLRYAGAHTHRLSGDWSLNVQNLPRGGNLRRALIAPPGHKVVTIDSSQIEARIVAWICGQDDLVQKFADKVDVYADFASELYQRPVGKTDIERFTGKTSILGLGFGAWWPTFQKQVKIQSRQQLGQEIDLSDELAQAIVVFYRRRYSSIPDNWKTLGGHINILAGRGGTALYGPKSLILEIVPGAVVLPNMLRLYYDKLEMQGDGWIYNFAGRPKKLYGAKLFENIVQALARIITMDAGVRMQKRLADACRGSSGNWLRLALQVHDELVYVVPDECVDIVSVILMQEMLKRPSWAPDLPLAAEIGVGQNYGEAK